MTKQQKTRDQIIWPFDPNKIPKSIHVLWSISSFGLSAMGSLIGVILFESSQPIASVIIFVFSIVMIGVGVYQIKQLNKKG